MSASRGDRYGPTFAVLAAGCVLFAMLQSLVLPALPTVQQHIHTSQHTVTWVLTAYLLSASVSTPIMGRVGDMVGKRSVFIFSVAALGVGSLLSALATSVPLMLAGRVICGIGGGLFPLAFGIVRDVFPPERVSGAIGALAALGGIGLGVGLVLTGPILDGLGYAWLFWLPLIVAAVTAAGALLFVPDSPVRLPGRIAWPAPVLLAGWLVALLVGISKAPDWGWGSVRVLVLIAVAVVLCVAWVRVELASDVPLIDMRMMRRPAVWTSNVVALLLGVGVYATFAFVPEFVQTSPVHGYGFGSTVTESGLIMLPQALATFVAGALAGGLLRRFAAKRLLTASYAVALVAFAMLALTHGHVWEIAAAVTLIGAGFGLVFSVIPNIIVGAVPPEQTGVAMGMNANIRNIGGAIGAAAMSTVIISSAGADGIPTEAGYSWAFGVIALSSAVGVLACLLVPADGDASAPPLDPEVAGTPLEYAELAMTPATPAREARPHIAGR